MDWSRFKRALEPLQANEGDCWEKYSQADLMHWMDEQSFILEFLTGLAEKLSEFKSTRQSTGAYPQLGPILTAASNHPFLCLDRRIAQATIQCLERYSQFETSDPQSSSAIWCVDRIRRLVRAPPAVSRMDHSYTMAVDSTFVPAEDWGTQCQIHKLMSNLDKRFLEGSLTPQIVSQLMDLSLALLEHGAASVLIERLINCGTVLMEMEQKKVYFGRTGSSEPNIQVPDKEDDDYALHFCTVPSIFSGHFVSRLLGYPHDRLWKLYRSWAPELIARIWKHQRPIMEYELLEFFQALATNKSYTPKSQVHKQLESTIVVQLLQKNFYLVSIAHKQVTMWVTHFSDWRIVRIWQHVINFLSTLETQSRQADYELFIFFPPDLRAIARTLGQSDVEDLCIEQTVGRCTMVLDRLTIYTYTGAFENIETRRNEAWVFALLFPDFLQECTACLIAWCSSKDVWDSKMDIISNYLGWLMCPSDDDRVDDTIESLKHWTISLKNFNTAQPKDALDIVLVHWNEIFNGNSLVAMSIAFSILIAAKDVWDNKDWSLMANKLFESPNDEPIMSESEETK
ncbi:hypothetical protein CLU79DRAFT_765737 [Phycomyces nitens]|nr:hypothetical protein CLU79DRAFT_765737 [Phycomyces nitens]